MQLLYNSNIVEMQSKHLCLWLNKPSRQISRQNCKASIKKLVLTLNKLLFLDHGRLFSLDVSAKTQNDFRITCQTTCIIC